MRVDIVWIKRVEVFIKLMQRSLPAFIILLMFTDVQAAPGNAVRGTNLFTDTAQVDVMDLVKSVFRRKNRPRLHPVRLNVNGPFITAIPYPNYSIVTGFAAAAPVNISFYTNPKEKGELSSFNNMFQYTQYNQIIAFSISNLYFGHDKWQLNGDWRFYKFPTTTYGLGTQTTEADAGRIDYQHLRVYETLMRSVAKNIDIGFGYNLDYHWGIKDYRAEEGIVTDFERYGHTDKSISSGVSLNFLYDSRNNNNSPTKGAYLNVQFRTYTKAFGGDNDWNSLIIDCRKYVALPIHWQAGFAFWAYASISLSGKPPYLDLPGTGMDTYNNTGRGYAMGRYRGTHMIYLESEFRVSLMRNGLLGAVVFGNLQTLSNWPSNNFTSVQPGGGVGLRIKLNKRTNTNSAVDYGFGSGNSRGFAFNLNEVF